MPVNLMWEGIFIWTILGGTLTFLFGVRLGFDKWLLINQSLRESVFLTCLYGSISVPFSIMSFTLLFGLNLSFGATGKDDEKISLMDSIKSTPMECSVYTFYTGLMVMRLLFLTAPNKRQFVIFFGCVPLMWCIFLFWAGPIFWNILPRKSTKTDQESYIKDDMMFADKDFTQLPNSAAFRKVKVGWNLKLAPSTSIAASSDIESCSSYSSLPSLNLDVSESEQSKQPKSTKKIKEAKTLRSGKCHISSSNRILARRSKF